MTEEIATAGTENTEGKSSPSAALGLKLWQSDVFSPSPPWLRALYD